MIFSLVSFLRSLKHDTLSSSFSLAPFYARSANCLSLFQSLSLSQTQNSNEPSKKSLYFVTAQMILQRLIFAGDGGMGSSSSVNPLIVKFGRDVSGWIPKDQETLKAAFSLLISLDILSKSNIHENQNGDGFGDGFGDELMLVEDDYDAFYAFDRNFQKNMQRTFLPQSTLFCDEDGLMFYLKDSSVGGMIAPETVENFSKSQWENILHFLVEPNNDDKRKGSISSLMKKILADAGLIKADSQGIVQITKDGFEFLLQSRHYQLWTFVSQLVKGSRDPNGCFDIFSFILEFGFTRLGCAYELNDVSIINSNGSIGILERLERTIETLVELGLLYRKTDKVIYPSSALIQFLVMDLSVADRNGLGIGANLSGSDGHIVVETNYRICAYTASPLQIAILNLFADLKLRFNNMVCGYLSQDSMKDAFDAGITADQVIAYLTAHAHPEMLKHAVSQKLSNPLPVSVRDQIRLWHLDRKRLSFSKEFRQVESFVLENLPSDAIFIIDHEKRKIIVRPEYHSSIVSFIKSELK